MKQLFFLLPLILIFTSCVPDIPETVRGVVCNETKREITCNCASPDSAVFIYEVHKECDDQRPTYLYASDDLLNVGDVIEAETEFCTYDDIEFYEQNELIRHSTFTLKITKFQHVGSVGVPKEMWGDQDSNF